MAEITEPEKCCNRWHWDLTWTFPYCPACESRERSPEARALAERIAELESQLARLENIHKVAAERVTDPSWPEREQDALKWLYQTTEAGWGVDALAPIAGTILAMLQEHTNSECREATERIVAQEECETLRARLARWRPIVRAAVLETEAENLAENHHWDLSIQDLAKIKTAPIDAAGRRRRATSTLSEQERSEILREDT